MRLPRDVALCDGNGEPACESCARRVADRPEGNCWWTLPAAEGDDCELRIELPRYELTDAGRKALGDGWGAVDKSGPSEFGTDEGAI